MVVDYFSLIFIIPMALMASVIIVLCCVRRSKRNSASNEPTSPNNFTIHAKRSQPNFNKPELVRHPPRHQLESPVKGDSADFFSRRPRRDAINYKVDVSYKDNGSHQTSAIHEDKTNMIIPSQLSTNETIDLLNEMYNFLSSEASEYTFRSKNAPVTHKVISYGVSDEITRRDSPLSFNSRVVNRFLADDSSKRRMEPLLVKLVLNGPRRYSFDYRELRDLLERGAKLYADESSLLEVPVPCVLYGDLHGQYSDLHRWLNLNGWPHQTVSAFLGDFVDRGSHGVEVIALITALKLTFPNRIFVVRGNHEEESLNRNYSFYDEVCQRFANKHEADLDGSKMYGHFKRLFMHLPLAVLVGGRVLGVHGGISPKLTSLQDIRNIVRPIEDFEVGTLECDLVWSDPDVDAKKDTRAAAIPFKPNFDREPMHGIGQLFSADSVKAVCRRLNIDIVIRGHQTPLQGYAFFANGHMITLFSAPGYKGTTVADVNFGASIEFSRDMVMTIKKLKVSEQFRRNRIIDCERRSSFTPLATVTTESSNSTQPQSKIAKVSSECKRF